MIKSCARGKDSSTCSISSLNLASRFFKINVGLFERERDFIAQRKLSKDDLILKLRVCQLKDSRSEGDAKDTSGDDEEVSSFSG